MWIQKLITTTLFIGHLFHLLICPFFYEDEGENIQKLMRTTMEKTWMVLLISFEYTLIVFNYLILHIDHGEDVDGLVALGPAVDPDQPDRPSYQPGNLEDDVD